MGCFLACFGFKHKNKKKRQKPSKNNHSGKQDHGSYVPLDSDVSIKLDIKENVTSDSDQLIERPKEAAIKKIKKKVTFNLNVKAYEPIPEYNDDDTGVCLSEGANWKFHTDTKSMATLHYEEEDVIASSIWSHPANHRYRNCRDSFEDEEESDLGSEETEDSNDEDGYGDENELISSQNVQSENTSVVEHFDDSLMKKSNVRDRRRYVSSVLNPVENLSQWKVVKAKEKQVRDTVAVDASLSNWLYN